jgi:hypothetical protein
MQDSTLVAEADLREFFRKEVERALETLKLECNEFTSFYLVNLLAEFGDTNELYEDADRPLALMYGKAMESAGPERFRILKKLGDFALYMAGYFADSLSGKAVDVDYYIAMGSNAYGSASRLLRAQPRGDVFGPVFIELSGRFPSYVDVLAQVSDNTGTSASDQDIMRLYDLWLKTKSKRCESLLRRMGMSLTEVSG